MAQGHRPSRAEQAALTRQTLIETALRLFADRGYDATTTEEVAEAAGVSPRTFFRYFPTKESVLLSGEIDFIRSFTGIYLAQPDGVPELAAMRASFVTLAPGLTRLRSRIKLYRQAVGSSVTLRGRESVNHAESVETLARAIAERRGLAIPDAGCGLLARLGMTVFEDAMTRWLDGPAQVAFGEVVEDVFRLLGTLVCSAPHGIDL